MVECYWGPWTDVLQPPSLRVLTSQNQKEQRTPDVGNRSDEHNGTYFMDKLREKASHVRGRGWQSNIVAAVIESGRRNTLKT